MKNLKIYFCLLVIMFTTFSEANSQCKLWYKKYLEECDILKITTKQKRIHYDFLTEHAVKLNFKNTASIIQLNLFLYLGDNWKMSKGQYIDIIFTDDDVLRLTTIEETIPIRKREDLIFSVYRERWTGIIKCHLNEEQYAVLKKHAIKKIKFNLLDGLEDFHINDKNSRKHKDLMECLENQFLKLSSKYPDAIKLSLSDTKYYKCIEDIESSTFSIVSPAENIYSHSFSLNSEDIQIAFGLDDGGYFCQLRSVTSSGLNINSNNYIKLLLANDEVLILKPADKRDLPHDLYGLSESYISEHGLNMLKDNNIVAIRIEYSNNSVKDYEIKTEKNHLHKKLIQYVLDENIH